MPHVGLKPEGLNISVVLQECSLTSSSADSSANDVEIVEVLASADKQLFSLSLLSTTGCWHYSQNLILSQHLPKIFLPLISWIAFPAICTMTQISFQSPEYELVLWTASCIVHLYYFLWERQLPNSFSSMLEMRFCNAGSTCAARLRLALVLSHWELNATLELVCCQAC